MKDAPTLWTFSRAFNTLVNIESVKGSDIKLSFSKKLKVTSCGFEKLDFLKKEYGRYFYKVIFRQMKDGEYRKYTSGPWKNTSVWIAYNFVCQNYKKTWDWLELFDGEFQVLKRIIPEIRDSKEIHPFHKEAILDRLTSRPEKGWLKYLEHQFLFDGINKVLEDISQSEVSSVNQSFAMSKAISDNERVNAFYQKRADIVNKDIKNFYPLGLMTDIKSYEYAQFCVKDAITSFFVKTDGFNQDFKFKKEKFSLVTLRQFDNKFYVRVAGADDFSFTRIFDKIEDANDVIWKIQRVSRLLTERHLKCLEFEFSN